jgi:hypothetical protein
MRRQFPSFLDAKCLEFIGCTLRVRPRGLRYYIDRHEEELDPRGEVQSSDMTVIPRSFFEEDDKIRGFVGEVHTPGHPLNSFKTVLSTLSDGEDFNFSDNLCPIWAAAFGDSEPPVGASGFREFKKGRVVLGRVIVFENELHLGELRKRLDTMDPRKGLRG